MRWTLTIIMTLALGCALDSPSGELLPLPGEEPNTSNGSTTDWRPETCNGIDDDGDGRIDNGMLYATGKAPHVQVGPGVAKRTHAMVPRVYGVSAEDLDVDGSDDAPAMEWVVGLSTTTTFTYDLNGNERTHEWVDNNGKLNTYVYRYDSEGKSTGLTYTLCAVDKSTCEYELEVLHTVDVEANMSATIYNHYVGPDRTLAEQIADTVTYNDDGNVVSTVRTFDTNVDGIPERGNATYYSYGAGEWVTLVEKDSDLDGKIDQCSHQQRDESGMVETISKDEGADGTVDTTTVNTYDELERLTEKTEDIGADGIIDNRWTHAYNAQGDRERTVFMATAGGTLSQLLTTNYNEYGDVLIRTEQKDLNGDGALQTVDVSTFTYDDDGNPLTGLSYRDVDSDGTFDWRRSETYTYNADGHLLSHSMDEDIDGDGTMDRQSSRTHVYNCAGNLVTTVFNTEDHHNDTHRNEITNYNFACHAP